jgi:YD repeat-containing protein
VRQDFVLLLAAAMVASLVPTAARAQTVLHLHKEKEPPPSSAYLMRQAQPDAASFAIVSPDRKNTTLVDNSFALFVSQAGDINNGTIPAGSTFTFLLYMKKSADVGQVYPRIMFRIVNPLEQTLCASVVTTQYGEITRTLTAFTLTCTTSAALTFLSTTYYELFVGEHWTQLPGSHSVTLEVDVEGPVLGSTDSRATVPTPAAGSTITSLSSTIGVPGQAVTINGSGFGATQGTGAVTFNGVPATVTSWGATAIGVTVPDGAATGFVVVWVNSTPSNGVPFTVTPAPTISSISPDTGVADQTVTLTGTNFTGTQGTVTFNGTPATVTNWTDTSVVVRVPATATSGPVVTSVNSQNSNGMTFTVIPPTGAAASYYLHSETSSTTGLFQLKPSGVDAASLAVQTVDLRGTSGGEFVIKEFDTQANVPNLAGAIPRGVTLSFTLWMKSTAAFGTLQPRARVRLNNASGALLCEATGASGITTTIAQYTLSCTIGSQVILTNTDRIYVWVGVNVPTSGLPGNHSVKGELDIEGNTAPTYDSRFSMPGVVPPPTLTGLNPTAGLVGQTVTISGSSFGAVQDLSYVTFNTVRASVCQTCWSDTAITAVVPSGAATGPVVVTRLQNSNPVNFTVQAAIAGSVTQGGSGTPIAGAVVQALQSGQVIASTTTTSAGGYSLNGLASGVYDVSVSLAGAGAQTRSGVAVSSATITTVNFALVIGGTVTYTYDSLDRLATVTDGSGAAARYSYDAVGNVQSIARLTGGTVSVFGMTPSTGPVGTTVTITGTGFGPDLSSNTVRFNGTTAAVVAAAVSQLTVLVPTGATSGTISVTSPNGSATSDATFVVMSDSGAPTLVSFSPTSGGAGTVVTLTGTKLDSVPSVAKLNLGQLAVTSATATTLGTAVPTIAASGRFSFTTPAGTAVSASDFFVPPDGYSFSGSPLGFTGRTTLGQTTTVTMASGTMGLLLFEGVAGQRVGVGARNVTGSFTCSDGTGTPKAALFLRNADGTPATVPSYCNGLGPYTLPETGTYEVVIGQATAATVSIFEVVDKAGTIAMNQPTQHPTVDVPGQRLRWTFAGVAGQPVGLQLTPPISFSVCSPTTVSITGPSGSTVLTFDACAYPFSFQQSFTLPSTGTYTIWTYVYLGDTGTVSLRLMTP